MDEVIGDVGEHEDRRKPMAREHETGKFESRHKVMRSPPQRRGSCPEVGKVREGLSGGTATQEDEEERRVKRKREDRMSLDEPMSVVTAGQILTLIKKVDAESQVLSVHAKERNTKKEIKETAVTLRALLCQLLAGGVQEAIRSLDTKEEEKEAVVVLNKELRKRVKCLEKEIDKIREATEVGDRQKIKDEILRNVNSYEDVRKISNLTWPEEFYKAALIKQGSPITENRNTDMVILMEGEDQTNVNAGIKVALLNRFPDAKDLEGSVAKLTIRTNLESSEEREERLRCVHKVELKHIRDWFNAVVEIKKLMVKYSRKTVAVYPPVDDRNGQFTRRIAEIVFRDTDMRCMIYVKQMESEGGGAVGKRTRTYETEAIKPGDESYAELLRKVKDKMETKPEVAKTIRTVRHTKEGHMLVVIDKKQEGVMENLKSELKEVTGKNKGEVVGRRSERAIIIKDMDELVNKEEVVEALAREFGLGSDDYRMSDFRPCYGGNQAVTVYAPYDKVECLIKAGKIKIGLNQCLVVERLKVQQCYRCWGYGHVRNECKGEDLSLRYRKCGEQGLKVQDCRSGLRCLNCKADGHAAGSGQCPEFRNALSRGRLREREKGRNN